MAPMKLLINILILILLSLILMSCGKPPSSSTPPQEEIKYPDPVPDYPIHLNEPPPQPRVNPNTVPLPPANDPAPVEPSFVLSAHRCFEGNPKNDLKHTTTIKIERHGFFVFRKTSIWMYDCHGGQTCEKLYQLNRVVHGAFEVKQYCMESIQDQNEFSICADGSLKPIETYRGDMIKMNAAVKGMPMTLYCETTLPLKN